MKPAVQLEASDLPKLERRSSMVIDADIGLQVDEAVLISIGMKWLPEWDHMPREMALRPAFHYSHLQDFL